MSAQRESVRTAIPHAEKRFATCRGRTRRARSAGPTDRRGALVPGGLDQQPGSAGASGRGGDPDSLLWSAFVDGDRCSGAPESRLAYSYGVAYAFDGDSSGDPGQRSETDSDRRRVRGVRIVKRSETTHVEELDESEQFARAEDDVDASDAAKPGRAVPEAWRNKGFRLSVIATAFVLAAGLSFGVGRAGVHTSNAVKRTATANASGR